MRELPVRLLLVDNYDSYTYNVYQMLREVKVGGYDVQVDVVQNDAVRWTDLERSLSRGQYHAVVLSPGPGTPHCEGDIGICKEILEFCVDLPILGICLGHQALAHTYGARIVKAPVPFHGRLSKVHLKEEANVKSGECSLLRDISRLRKEHEFDVVRYHSLVVDEKTLPDCIETLAWADTDDETRGHRLIMALRHTEYPHYGVQFHPESICTCHGDVIFKNFIQITIDHCVEKNRMERPSTNSTGDAIQQQHKEDTATLLGSHDDCHRVQLHSSTQAMVTNACVIRSDQCIDTERLFLNCCCGRRQDGGEEGFNYGDTFWLDSSNLKHSGARFSFMGKKGGSLWRKLKYQLSDSDCEELGTFRIEDAEGGAEEYSFPRGSGTTFWDAFDEIVERTRSCGSNQQEICFIDPSEYACKIPSSSFSACDSEPMNELPFEFQCGFVGFIGYEMKEECGGAREHRSPYPDVSFFFEDQLIAVDHEKNTVYLVEICEKRLDTTSGWMNEVLGKLDSAVDMEIVNEGGGVGGLEDKLVKWSRTREEYIRDIGTCKRYLLDGDSYEICLTNRLKIDKGVSDPLAFYTVLRKKNPAPYSAFFCFAQDDADADVKEGSGSNSNDLAICCSSPERFLKLTRDGTLEAKPIKGTIRRGVTPNEDLAALRTLQQSDKDRAENLMIVDLLRNDLGRVSKVGSVHVPKLMDIESFATVHQMVSTVRGMKASDVSPVRCIRAAFPAGSMTGAPKVRTMQIIDTLEKEARGVYSGSIGYISPFSNGAFDLNVVIRSAVMSSKVTTIGAGGAITIQSEAESEHDEIKVKAEVILETMKAASRSRLKIRSK